MAEHPTPAVLAVVVASLHSFGLEPESADQLVLARWPGLPQGALASAWSAAGEGALLAADCLDREHRRPTLRVVGDGPEAA